MAESLDTERTDTPVSAPRPGAPIGADRSPAGWTPLAIFVAKIAGIIAEPAPTGVVAVVGLTRWWKVGLVASIVSLTVFGTVGTAWTKLVGLW